MTKHRIELFSDGVFAIILTLLVLDLRVPAAHGLGALREVWPSLIVHAGSFVLVSVLRMLHQGALERITEFTQAGLRFNLVSLFWSTLVPFGARNAAERPLEPLGPSLLSLSTGLFVISVLFMRLNTHSTYDEAPEMRQWVRLRRAVFRALSMRNLAAAALSWIAPWSGYIGPAGLVTFLLLGETPAEAERRLRGLSAVDPINRP